MDGMETLCRFLDGVSKDARMGPVHIALFTAIVKCGKEQKQECPIIIFGHSLRKIAKISGPATYHRVINDLVAYGFIHYEASFNPNKGSKITIVEFKN